MRVIVAIALWWLLMAGFWVALYPHKFAEWRLAISGANCICEP